MQRPTHLSSIACCSYVDQGEKHDRIKTVYILCEDGGEAEDTCTIIFSSSAPTYEDYLQDVCITLPCVTKLDSADEGVSCKVL
jgi:hypothetical protein